VRGPLLILGGTFEGRQLADRLHMAGVSVLSSLAGRTRSPRLPAGRVRSGSLGGAQGLAWLIAREAVPMVVDATHPFALRITETAHAVCRELGVPYLRLERPPWEPVPGDRWIEVEDLDAALAAIVTVGRRPFVSVGRADVPRLAEASACRFLLRTIEPPEPGRVPANVGIVTGHPPHQVESEIALFRREGVDSLLVRNSGGPGAYPKIAAARELGLPVVMIRRPSLRVAPAVGSVEEAYSAVLRRLGRSR